LIIENLHEQHSEERSPKMVGVIGQEVKGVIEKRREKEFCSSRLPLPDQTEYRQ
jgi:hypothetical protein